MSLQIIRECETELDLDMEAVAGQVVEQALDYVNCPYEVELNVTLTDNESIREINREYRQIDRPTDVLSFQMCIRDSATAVENEIITMPNYFADYDTTVYFISEEELRANHSGIPHGLSLIHI